MLRIAAFFIVCGSVLYANGIVIPNHPPHPPVVPYARAARPLAFKKVSLKVDIQEQVAKTEVEEVFQNANNTRLEGTFLLPVPRSAQISGFSFFIDGKEVKGEILSSDKARQYYQDIVSRLKDPAILEYMGQGLIRVKLFPVPPHGEAKIHFVYNQLLKSEAGQLKYYYPFGTNKFSLKPLSQVVVDINVQSSLPLRAIYAPNYNIDIVRKGDKKARLSFEKKNFLPKEDLIVYIGRSEEDFGVTTVTYRSGKEDGYFLLVVSPKQEFGSSKIVPKDIVFVLDTSGSMAGEKLEQAKEALSYCVRSLSKKDRFNLVVFSTEGRTFKPDLVNPTGENVAASLAFIEGIKAIGGTNIDEALRMALKQKKDKTSRPFMVVFLTDGQPTVGVTDIEKILKNVSEGKSEGLRLFVFGVGNDVNTILLDRLAEDNRGTRNYVQPKENIETRVSSFYQQVARPVLSDVELKFSAGGIHDMYPAGITDIFYGRQVILLGRYSEFGKQVFEISGKSNGKEYSYRFPVKFPERERGASSIPRLWATRKIGYLLDEIRLHGKKKELVDEVKFLAKRFGIVTPYTSYFVHDESALALSGGRPANRVVSKGSVDIFGGGGQIQLARRGRNASTGIAPEGKDSGKDAVDRSLTFAKLKKADRTSPAGLPGLREDSKPLIRYVGAKTFYLKKGVWIDSLYKVGMKEKKIKYLSKEYFELLSENPELGRFFSLGKKIIVCVDSRALVVSSE